MSLMTCGIGYSNILFGIMFLEAYMGSETHRSCLGIKIRKIIIPWIYLVIIQLCFPEASMWGHLCGLISAVLLKHSGIAWVLLPHHEWIAGFEDAHKGCLDCVDRWCTYYKVTDEQNTFAVPMSTALCWLAAKCCNKSASSRGQRGSSAGQQQSQGHTLQDLAMRQMPIGDEERRRGGSA